MKSKSWWPELAFQIEHSGTGSVTTICSHSLALKFLSVGNVRICSTGVLQQTGLSNMQLHCGYIAALFVVPPVH